MQIKRAFISVSDKTGLLPLAKHLIEQGVEIVSSGGTAAYLIAENLPVKTVSDLTGYPEMLEGRVKTLHPMIHGAILADRNRDQATIEKMNIPLIDLVIVNLYPFEEVLNKPNLSMNEVIELIDIGGPALIRGAAKNYQHVLILTNPVDYAWLDQHLIDQGTVFDSADLFHFSAKAFAHTADYDRMIASNLAQRLSSSESQDDNLAQLPKLASPQALRYGENPHQSAHISPYLSSKSTFSLLSGKPLSYNNILDIEANLMTLSHLSDYVATCVIVKHNTPCGVAVAKTPLEAYQKAYAADPISAFGGIIGMNVPLNAQDVQVILDNQFVEVIIAPDFEDSSIMKACFQAKPNVRFLKLDANKLIQTGNWRSSALGFLYQEADSIQTDVNKWTWVSGKANHSLNTGLRFAWEVVRTVRSNAIVLANQYLQTIGIGTGQTNRVGSVKIAIEQAKQSNFSLEGAILASDGFFPFADSIELIAKEGIYNIIQPGGSMRDNQVIESAKNLNINMVMTHRRHFMH